MTKRHIIDLSGKELAMIAAEAGHRAVTESQALGLSVVGSVANKIIRKYPDGKIEKICSSHDLI
jgi:hypothetical protein